MAASTTPMRPAGTQLLVTYDSKTDQPIGHLTELGELAQDSEEIDITTLDSTGAYREYLPGFKDAGQMALRGYYAPGDETQKILNTLYKNGETARWAIKFNDGSRLEFNAFVKGVTFGPTNVDQVPGFGATLRVSGVVDEVPPTA